MEAVTSMATQSSGLMRFAMAVLSIVAVWRLAPMVPAHIALAAIAALFLLSRKRPVWAIAAVLVSQLSITSYMIPLPVGPAISLRLVLLLLTLVMMWPYLVQNRLALTSSTRAVLIPTLALTGWSLIANLTGSGFDFAFKDLRNMIVAILIILFLPMLTKGVKELKLLTTVGLVTVTASAAVGIAQYYGFLGMDRQTVVPGFLERLKGFARVPGITESFLNLSYALSVAITVTAGTYLAKAVDKRSQPILIWSAMLMAVALYFTFTRSNYLALVMGGTALALFMKSRLNAASVIAIVLAGVSIFEFSGIMENQFLGGRSTESQDKSTLSRKVLWQAGTAIAMDNPVLGIGGDQFKIVSPQYSSRVDPALMARQEAYWSYRDLGSQEPHNDYLFFAVSYGLPALGAYVWLLVATLRNFLAAYRLSPQPFVRGLSLGMASGTVVYIGNAFYHNMMITFPLFWILAGFSAVTANLGPERKTPFQPEAGKARE